MKFDFDKIINRRGTNCYKYDEMPNDDTIALWVADMDFETAPCITEALRRRMEHGCFGYTMVPDSFYQATINWFADRHGWQGIKKEWFIYTSGVVPAISAIIKAVTEPGDKVLVQTPVYNCSIHPYVTTDVP
jgi:cystathionine beta-lyase